MGNWRHKPGAVYSRIPHLDITNRECSYNLSITPISPLACTSGHLSNNTVGSHDPTLTLWHASGMSDICISSQGHHSRCKHWHMCFLTFQLSWSHPLVVGFSFSPHKKDNWPESIFERTCIFKSAYMYIGFRSFETPWIIGWMVLKTGGPPLSQY